MINVKLINKYANYLLFTPNHYLDQDRRWPHIIQFTNYNNVALLKA